MTSPGLSEQEFFARVQQQLGTDAHRTPDIIPTVPEPLLRTTSKRAPLPAVFQQQCQAVGVNCHLLSESALASSLQSELSTLAIDTQTELCLQIEDRDLQQIAHQACATHSTTQSQPKLTITSAHLAIAESGSLILSSSKHISRQQFMLAQEHWVILREQQLVPDLIDAWNKLPTDAAYQVIITGPSKTADIEGVLITGVHGPGKVQVFLVLE